MVGNNFCVSTLTSGPSESLGGNVGRSQEAQLPFQLSTVPLGCQDLMQNDNFLFHLCWLGHELFLISLYQTLNSSSLDSHHCVNRDILQGVRLQTFVRRIQDDILASRVYVQRVAGPQLVLVLELQVL